ncbi:hypothetical protein AN958_00211, partial [Leucoagaricus sp. SymC.cos]
DDGQSPLLSAIGVCSVGLYTGKQQLVQTIAPVDVSQSHSLTFTPNAAAGPDSNTYYISFISTSAKQNPSLPYAAFSPFFQLDGMKGSFDLPNPSATQSIPIPTSLTTGGQSTNSNSGDVLSTITVGTLSTSTSSSPTSGTPSTPSSPSAPAASSSSSRLTITSPILASSRVTTRTGPPPTSIPSTIPSGSLTTAVTSPLPPIVTSSSSTTSPTSTLTNSNGATRMNLSGGTGISAVLIVVGLFVAL